MLAAEVTTPVPSRSSDPTNHKREKLPMVLACLRYWFGELALTNTVNQSIELEIVVTPIVRVPIKLFRNFVNAKNQNYNTK